MAPRAAAVTAATAPPSTPPGRGSGSRGIRASTAITDEHDAEPPGRPEVAGEPTARAGRGSRATGRAAGRSRGAGCAGAVEDRGQPPRREQHRHAREHGGRGSPHRAVARQRRRDDEADADQGHTENGGEEPGDRRERRDQRQQQPRTPRGAPAPVGLRVGEAERGVRQPRQDRGDDDDPEPAVAPRPADDRDQRVGGRAPPRAASAARPPASTQVADHAEEPPRSPQRHRHGEQQDRRHRGDRRCRRAPWPAARSPARTAARGRRSPARAGARTRRAAATGLERRRGGGESPTADGADRLAGTEEHQQHEQRDAERHRVGEEPGHQAGVGLGRLVVGRSVGGGRRG